VIKGKYLLAAGLLCGAALFTTGCSTAAGYVKAAEDTISAENLRDQYKFVTNNWEALIQTADNACAAQGSTTSDSGPVLVEGAGLAYASTYRTVVAKYNARQDDIFEAGFVGPPGYPKEIPNYVSGQDPDFCGISTNLIDLKIAAEQNQPTG
jgi:hypothetical protein